jgi:DNA-binding transcriptional ArsR family regulator
MEKSEAIAALSALGHDRRLEIVRMLVAAEPQGMQAGALAAALRVPASSLSANLAILERAGLVCGRREGRAVRYRAGMAGLAALIAYLTQDCCGGRPELCLPGPIPAPTSPGRSPPCPQPSMSSSSAPAIPPARSSPRRS